MARPVEERAGVGSPVGADLSGVDVFLSHVEEDKAVALQLADGLEAAGYSTWCYERDTIPGPSYLLQTSRAIEQSRAVLVLISPDSLGSHQVTSEVVRAHEEVKPFIPLLIGISREEFGARQPEWREAVGSAATLDLPDGRVGAVIPRIVDGLTALGVSPHPGGPPPKRLSFAPAAAPGGGVRRTPRRAVLAAAVAAVVLVAGGVVAVLALRDGSEPAGTSTGAPTAAPSTTPTTEPTDQGTSDSTAGLPDAATTPVVTGKGKARVSARLVSKYCNLAGDCKTAPSGRRFLLLDVTAWQSGADLGYDPDVSMEAFGSLVLFQGERVTPNESMLLEGPPAGMTVVYPTLPPSAAGAAVILHWPDNPALRVHVKG